MKRLVLLRHAKSDWDADYGTDHERPLARRGVEAATTMGLVLAHSREIPDHVITSSAVRAQTTVEIAMESGGWKCGLDVSDDLYGASPMSSLRVAATAPAGVERLMLVGHEPTWSSLVHHLTGARVAVKTATVVGIDLAIASWKQAVDATGEIAYLLQPRLFTDGDWPARAARPSRNEPS